MAVNLKIVSQVVASGTPGPAGKSAYQIAVDNGFEGTESEWLKELHPFKGWFDSASELEEEHPAPSVGEYAYVKGATSSDPVKIYECSTEGSWSDSGRTVDTSTVQTFRSGEAVNDVDITDDSSEIEENSDKIPTAGAVANALSGVIYDVSAKNPTAGPNNDGKWESLFALLSDANLNTLIPTSVRKGGMSIKFVCSSDNKYVQYMLNTHTWTTDIRYWEKTNLQDKITQLEEIIGCESLYLKYEQFSFVSGGILSIDGSEYVSDKRVRTGFIPANNGIRIIANHALFAVVKYDKNKVYIGYAFDWTNNTNDSVIFGFDGYLRIIMRKDTEDSVIDAGEIAGFMSKIDVSLLTNDFLVNGIPLELGGFSTTDGSNIEDYSRVRSDFIKVNGGFSLIADKSTVAFIICDENKNVQTIVSYDEYDGIYIKEDFYGYVRFVLKKDVSGSQMTESDLPNLKKRIYLNLSTNSLKYLVSQTQINEILTTDYILRDKYDADARLRTLPSESEESSVGTRFKLVFKVNKGEWIFSRQNNVSLGQYNYMVIFDTFENAKKVSPVGILQRIYDGWTEHAIYAKAEVDGYVAIASRNSSNNAITDEEMEALFKGFDVYIGKNNPMVKEESKTNIYLNSFAQKGLTATGLGDDNSKRVSVKSLIAVPYPSVEFTFILPPFIKVEIRSGSDASNLSNHQHWFINGDKITIPSGDRFYRIAFARQTEVSGVRPSVYKPDNNDDNLSVADIIDYIEKGDLFAYYNEGNKISVVEENSAEEKYIKAVKYVDADNVNVNCYPNRLPLFIHTSDVHGDYTRFNRVMDYADFIEADGVLVTGDMVAWNGNSYMDYIHDSFDEHKTQGLICMGNHDAFGTNKVLSAQYNNVMKRAIDKFGYNVPSVTYPTYYYKDFPAKKIRVIALNEFERTDVNANYSWYSPEQLSWFINTLLSTPQDYGVIVLFHRPENAIERVSGSDKFYETSIPYAQYQSNTITGTPISKIVDAFISGTSINTTFTEKDPDTDEVITQNIVADFSSKNSGVEFLFYANGHEHSDRIGIVPNTTNRQLVCNVLSCISIYNPDHPYYAELTDLPRGGQGSCQDAFNIYVIDRENHRIRIARVGSNMTSQLTLRDYMVMDYVNS